MSNRRFQRLALAAAVLGAVHGLAQIPFVSHHVTSDSETYIQPALGLLDGGYTSTFYHGVTAPYTGRTPGYPLFLALLGGGDEGTSQWIVLIVQALLMGVAIWITAVAARRLFDARVGVLAAFLLALDPYTKRYVTLVMTEILALALAAAASYTFLRAYKDQQTRWWAGAGALVGTLVLIRPFFAVVVPLLALAALVRGTGRTRALAAAVAACTALAVLSPWLARNTAVLGTPALGSYADGANFLIAAMGQGIGRPDEDVYVDPDFVRFQRGAEARYLPGRREVVANPESAARGELAVDRAQYREGVRVYGRRIRIEPEEVGAEYLGRVLLFWAVHEDQLQYHPRGVAGALHEIGSSIVLLLALVGAVLAVIRGGARRALGWFLIGIPFLSAVVLVEPRYAVPLRGLALTMAAAGLLELARTWSRRPATLTA